MGGVQTVMAAVTTMGVDGFLEGLRRCGASPALHGDVVTFHVSGVGAAHLNDVETGVGVAELQPWPAIPPHWLHLPETISLPRTNADSNETLPGWRRHSRQIAAWGDAQEPAQAWIAHVRAVLLEAL